MSDVDRAADAYRWGVAAVIVFVAGALISAFLPLEGPAAGREATALWLDEAATLYIVGWLNQTVMMLACSVIFAVAAWAISAIAPAQAILAWTATLISTVIFLITKFFAAWTVPFAAEAFAAGGVGGESAEMTLRLLNSSEAFGLVSSLDYLGFWLYGVIAFALARPLLQASKTHASTAALVAALAFALYGGALHLAFAGAFVGALAPQEFHFAVMSLGVLLLVSYVALLFYFRGRTAVSSAAAMA